MNKIKLIYDVVGAMKKKEAVKGSLKVQGKKDQVEFFSLENIFAKNLVTGEIKAKITTALESQEKKFKHQSSTELNLKNCHAGLYHGPERAWHHHGPHKYGGFKHKLDKLAFILKLLDNLQAEEQQDKTCLLSLTLEEIPEVFKKSIQQGQDPEIFKERSGHSCCLKELGTMEKANINLTVKLNKDKEIEKIQFSVVGQNPEDNRIQEISFQGELELNS